MRTLRNETGSLLIVALWSLAIIGVLAAGVSQHARLALRLSEYQWDDIRLAAGVKAAVASCVGLLNEGDSAVTALNQPWRDPAVFKGCSIPHGNFTVELADEESKINLNHAVPEELSRIFPDAPECVAALRGARLRSVAELLVVNGMTAEIYRRVANSITVYGSGRININTAGAEAFGYLGMKHPLREKISAFRAGPDGKIGTADDGVLQNLASAVGDLDQRVALDGEEKAILNGLLSRDKLTVKSDVYSGDFTVRLDDKPIMRKYHLVFESGSGRILSWREDI